MLIVLEFLLVGYSSTAELGSFFYHLSQAIIKHQWTVVCLKFNWERICSQDHVVGSRMWLLVGYWMEGLSSSLAVGQRPSSIPCKWASLVCFIKHTNQGGIRESQQSFITQPEGTSYHLCLIYWLETSHYIQPTHKGRG